jgi:hypothetical protein
MKKFFVTLLFLIIIAGVCLFFGWAQQGVPPDSCGIIISKSHGIDQQLVLPGEFRWIWYKLLPTNAKTLVFRIAPINHDFFVKNSLPSGKFYSSFAGFDDDFSWEINAGISFNLRSSALISLVSANIIASQEDLINHQKDIAMQIEAVILRKMGTDNELSGQVEEFLINGESPQMEREIQGLFPDIENISIKIKSAKFPDFSLYREAKRLYETYIAMQREYMTGDLREQARTRIDSLIRYDELELYGALLTRYPILIDYLALEYGKR